MAGHALYGLAPSLGHHGLLLKLKIIGLVSAATEDILMSPEAVFGDRRCLSGMAGHALYGMAPFFGRTGVIFDD